MSHLCTYYKHIIQDICIYIETLLAENELASANIRMNICACIVIK